MTQDEKLASLKLKLGEDVASDEILLDTLKDAEQIVLNRLYELTDIPNGATVPNRYGSVQVRIAVELFNKRGAEGQTSHSENGISRTYESVGVSPSLLREIKPFVGTVIKNA